MSASVRFAAKGVICGSFRRPSRNLMSCQWVKKTGCPASDGVPGMVALPSGPWHAPHGSAFFRPASTSAAIAGAGRAVIVAAIRTAARTARATGGIERPCRAGRQGRSPGWMRPSALVADAVDRARVVVGDQEGPVLHLLGVDG